MAKINDNDMEVIMKADQEEVIRKMLNDRLYCLIKLPAKKPDKIIGKYSSSIFVSFINSCLGRSLGIRDVGSNSLYEECEYYLCMYHSRGIDEKKREIFIKQPGKIAEIGEVIYPSIDELISFLKGKEFVLITNYMHYGNMEAMKTEDFLEDILLIWENRENEFIRREEKCEVRIYLNEIEDGNSEKSNIMSSVDIRKLKLEQSILKILEKKSRKLFQEDYYSVEYETQSEDVQSVNFTTRFHSNTAWEADPINYVYVRLSAFVLPGKAPVEEFKNTPKKKSTASCDGKNYLIDSIHFNSDIFDDVEEFSKFIDSYFFYFAMD